MPVIRRTEQLAHLGSDEERRPLFESEQFPSTSGCINSSHGSEAPRIKTMRELGTLNLLSQKYESLDYDPCENAPYMDDQRTTTFRQIRRTNVTRWLVILVIGILTAITACLIDMCIETICHYKFDLLQHWMTRCIRDDCIIVPYLAWVGMNAGAVLAGSALVAYVAPVAAASGIPVIKCYLNWRQGARGGPFQDPAGQGGRRGALCRRRTGRRKGRTNDPLRIRDSGRRVAGKEHDIPKGPGGGVLFSLEEGASFWNQSLTWRIFFCSTISAFSLSMILSAFHGHAGELSFSGLVNFGEFEDVQWNIMELPIYIVMGATGGLLGAIFNYVNFRLTVFRIRQAIWALLTPYLYRRWTKVVEAVMVAVVTASVAFLMIDVSTDCRPHMDEFKDDSLQLNCSDGRYSALGQIWFQTPEASVRSLFHQPEGKC
ncbi:hypothetical protein HPB47_001988 [Ixodes persulcatus]|uniref:Uncharacterized protein n=1 Tax=Ixodes persulcatus TaxID=34615 RepID=A0AC60PNQ2_IXOPE|nr:hypothetical protein HPB47_001988 [Ixodes persulcatus]